MQLHWQTEGEYQWRESMMGVCVSAELPRQNQDISVRGLRSLPFCIRVLPNSYRSGKGEGLDQDIQQEW